jgi:hypothetical protein
VGKQPREARGIDLEYCFDRLSTQKIGMAYRLLVPSKTWRTGSSGEEVAAVPVGGENEDSCDLRKGLI